MTRCEDSYFTRLQLSHPSRFANFWLLLLRRCSFHEHNVFMNSTSVKLRLFQDLHEVSNPFLLHHNKKNKPSSNFIFLITPSIATRPPATTIASTLQKNQLLSFYPSTKMAEQEQLNFIIHPHTHDVLSGRGNLVNRHPGNKHFRSL